MDNVNFQTPAYICEYMTSLIESSGHSILEPTKGSGNLVTALKAKGKVTAPEDFFKIQKTRFDYIVMNPPFTPMKLGYEILYRCMQMTDNIIALMPWLTLINSQKRTNDVTAFGLKSITHLPRTVFQGSRVQTCILQMKKGYTGETRFINYKK